MADRIQTPTSITLSEHDGERTLSYRWFGRGAWGSLVGLAIIAFPLAMLARSAYKQDLVLGYIVLVANVPVLAGVLYYVLLQFVNKTTLHVSNNQIHVRHHPIPLILGSGSKVLERNELQDVEAKPIRFTVVGISNTEKCYSVFGVLADDSTCTIMRGLDASEAWFIVQQLREWCALPVHHDERKVDVRA